jgi:hypothetical protein
MSERKAEGLCPDATIKQYWEKGYFLAIPTHRENHRSTGSTMQHDEE